MAIRRVWHGWTSIENADKYQSVLFEHVLPGIEAKKIPGYRKIEVLRTEHEHEVEFVTVMTFDSLESVIAFQGEDYTRCYVPDEAQRVLKRWDQVAAHYEAIDIRIYD